MAQGSPRESGYAESLHELARDEFLAVAEFGSVREGRSGGGRETAIGRTAARDARTRGTRSVASPVRRRFAPPPREAVALTHSGRFARRSSESTSDQNRSHGSRSSSGNRARASRVRTPARS